MMPKKLFACVLILSLMATMTGCTDYAIKDAGTTPQVAADNPFDAIEQNAGSLGAISHGEVDPNRDENHHVLPYEYEGGEFSFDYRFSAEGKIEDMGFLLFLDGEPQAYKVNDTDAAYEYFHSFPVVGTAEETFTFLFTPQSGKKGDTLGLTVVSVTDSGFQPDMVESTSYGWHHKVLERALALHFRADPPENKVSYPPVNSVFSTVDVGEEKITNSFVEHDLAQNGWDGVSMDTIDDGIYFTTTYGGALVYDNVNATDPVTVRYTLCGTAGTKYAVSFFIDHQPVLGEDIIAHTATLSKGNVWTIEATFDPAKLKDLNTFYIIAVPAGSTDFAPVSKSCSILLYKEK